MMPQQAHKKRGRPPHDRTDPFGYAMRDIRERCDRALEMKDFMSNEELLILETIRGMAST